MAATRGQLERWFDNGAGHKRMVIFCDTFDMADGDCCYPVYYDETGDELREAMRSNGDRLMEVYDLTLSKDMQMSERRAFHY